MGRLQTRQLLPDVDTMREGGVLGQTTYCVPSLG
jgi:hypothetical protein